MAYTFGILFGLIIILLLVYINQYNRIKISRNQIENAKSSLDALFIKRNELVPNLISVLEQHTDYESNLLEKITELRQSVQNNKDSYQQEGKTDKILKQLMIQVENYPQLQASKQFNNLHFSINECEEQIAAGRRYLSSSITYYNNTVTTFPGNIVAGISSMQAHEWERATEVQQKKIEVKEMFSKKGS